MKHCVRCGWNARKGEKRRLCPQCESPTSAVLFIRITDGDNKILYEGLDKEQADILWEMAKHNHPLVKRIEYAYPTTADAMDRFDALYHFQHGDGGETEGFPGLQIEPGELKEEQGCL